jgi:GNAT superfamily N-acetyltransferase
MRAREFTPKIRFNIEPYESWSGWGAIVQAYDGNEEVGHVIFEPMNDDETKWYAADVEVEEAYQRKGIATKMYDMAKAAAKKKGAIIVRSHTQTDDGRSLWHDKKVWEQQVNEYKEYPTQEYEGVTFTMKEKDGQLIVKALNDYGIPMGHVHFNMDGKILDPQDLEVYHKYQGQGIARVMYDYIKSQGFTIERSWDQTEAGKGFWDKHRGEDVRVWES